MHGFSPWKEHSAFHLLLNRNIWVNIHEVGKLLTRLPWKKEWLYLCLPVQMIIPIVGNRYSKPDSSVRTGWTTWNHASELPSDQLCATWLCVTILARSFPKMRLNTNSGAGKNAGRLFKNLISVERLGSNTETYNLKPSLNRFDTGLGADQQKKRI